MFSGSCKETIKGRMHLLTNTEGKIANYVLEHYDEVLNYNISELAENAGVSDASVVRFCKNLGYKGYQDFKVNAARILISVPQIAAFFISKSISLSPITGFGISVGAKSFGPFKTTALITFTPFLNLIELYHI